ncbi:hypothetical protein [Psychrobium sp. 1_MG-2023]|uniref:hypothetical protein n=1 Tax=Psychrobium sp. 1_MG-2023 TaxID=3062624 RepID=UPI000C34563A|nr:hypothetical protein [Psychrobium sp. 1_MG-2023]MDP2560867.1 hypothetical protein [Psychrobium sp. 1_MG-2023]PKF56740.1 hypothetical protein CW748_09695 [Alteromonadales bacterium alter-6D02]
MKQWQTLNAKYSQMTLREKALTLGTILVVLIFGSSHLIIEPMFVQYQGLSSDSRKLQNSINEVNQQRQEVEDKLATNPLLQLELQLERLNLQHIDLEEKLQQKELSLISHEEMARTLQYILLENSQLKLLKLKSKPAKEILLAAEQQHGETATALLYQHGMEVEVRGTYFAILKFLQQLEQSQQPLQWGNFIYEVVEYPYASISFELNAVSTDKEFIGVKK